MCKSHPRPHASSTPSTGVPRHGGKGVMGTFLSVMLCLLFVTVVSMLPCARGEVALLHKANGVYRGASSVVSAVDAAAAAGNAVLLAGDPENRLLVAGEDDEARKLAEIEIVPIALVEEGVSKSEPNAAAEAANDSVVAEAEAGVKSRAASRQRVETREEPEHEEEAHMSIWARLGNVTGAAFAMLLVSLIGVFLPTLIARFGRRYSPRKQKLIESLGTAFAAGGFWGLALVHVFLEAVTFLENTGTGLFLGPHNSFLNGAFPLALIGYLSLLFIHNLAVTCIRRNQKYSIGKQQGERERLRMACMDAGVASLALMVHAFFEGMVAGMRDDALLIWVAALSIMGHKWAESFALTQQMRAHGLPTRVKVIFLAIVLAASPIGAWVGLGISAAYEEGRTVGILNALSAGILIFVAGHCTGDVFGSHDHEHVHNTIHNDRTSPAVECRKEELSCCSNSIDCDLKATAGSPVFSDGSVHAHTNYHAMGSPPDPFHAHNAEHDHEHDHKNDTGAGPEMTCKDHYHYLESDPLDGSLKVLFLRMLFLCLGSGLVFSLMIVHMIHSGHDHSLHAEASIPVSASMFA